MAIRNKEYYAQFNEELKQDLRSLDYHIQMAENYKRIYLLTKGDIWPDCHSSHEPDPPRGHSQKGVQECTVC